MMIFSKNTVFALVFGTFFVSGYAYGAEMSMPQKCMAKDAKMGMSMDQPMDMPGMEMKDFQKEMMEGMKKMDPAMMQGMMQNDADVAFVCGMIAHHMGAIQMSEVELKHGDNDWAKQMAQKIIAAQKSEIAEMTKWVDENAK
jgi:uncharacterized protein (DUF305 family)